VFSVDWPIESALRISPTYAAFEFPTSADLAQSGPAIARFVESTIGAPGVFLIEPTKSERVLRLTAEVYAPRRATPLRRASILLTGVSRTDADRAIALARFVGLREHDPSVTVEVETEETATASKSMSTPAPTPTPPTPTPSDTHASMVRTAAVATLQAPAPAPAPTPTMSTSHLVPGVMVGGGLVLGGGGSYLLWSRSSRSLGQAAGVAGAVAGLLAVTYGTCWLIDDYFIHSTQVDAMRSSKRNTAIGFVPLDRGGAVTLAGQF
jgi:hypothetical protein